MDFQPYCRYEDIRVLGSISKASRGGGVVWGGVGWVCGVCVGDGWGGGCVCVCVIASISVTHLFGERKDKEKNLTGCAIFTLISINKHYCAMSHNLFCPPFLKRFFFITFYFIFYYSLSICYLDYLFFFFFSFFLI